MWWHYWQGNGLAIHRLRVRVSAEHHCLVTLGKLLNLSASVTKQYKLVLAKRGEMYHCQMCLVIFRIVGRITGMDGVCEKRRLQTSFKSINSWSKSYVKS